VNALAPKLILTPLLVASTSIAGRRWGAAFSGWLIALPLTSGPIAFFIALELGPRAATEAAAGSLLGAIGQVAFGVAYARASERLGWQGSVLVAAIAFAAVGLLVPPLPAPALFAAVLAAVGAGLWSTRRIKASSLAAPIVPRWDIPARVVVATILVLAIGAVAPIIGGRSSGILATFPVYASVLATFAHQLRSSGDAVAVLRGLMLGLFGFATFFLVLGFLLESAGVGVAFLTSIVAALAVQALTLPLLIRLETSAEGRP
jgi:hypothetical protein